MSQVQARIMGSVDYLTVTTLSSQSSAALISSLLETLGSEFLYKERSKRWSFLGFHGRAYEGIRYGLKGDEAIVMLSGPQAANLWALVAPKRRHCTRIDLAVTAVLAQANEDVAKASYASALDGGAIRASYITNSQSGTTCYLGSRTSRFFGRLYDKGAQQGIGAGACWRYEVEAKKPASEAILTTLLESKEPALWIASFVWEWFNVRGVEPIFTSTDVESAIEISATVKSSDKSLEWLSTQVRPTVGRLMIEGRQTEVVEALGLPKDYNSTDAPKEGAS